MQELKNQEELVALINSEKILVLDFTSKTCAPCSAIKEKLTFWGRAKAGITLRSVSIEEHPKLAADLEIFSAPTVLVFAEGKLTIKEAGYFSLSQLIEKIERLESLL